jgi:hypothetical protein
MNVRLSMAGATVSVLALAVVAPAASAQTVAGPAARPSITQSYDCQTPVGQETLSASVTGKASIKKGKIVLKKVVYAVTNSTGFDLVIDSAKLSTPDPNAADAPYAKKSAKVKKKAAGWTAGHDSSGVFAAFSGSMSIPDGSDVMSAPLSAKYAVKGPHGTEIDFQPGDVSFHVTSPLKGDVTCTPGDPVGTFASVTE